MKVGFVGLGIMGGEQARLLATKNFDLTVYDVSDDAMRAFEGKATLAGSVADRADPDYQSFVESQCGIGEKDLSLAGLLADEAGVSAPTAEHVRRHLRSIFADFS